MFFMKQQFPFTVNFFPHLFLLLFFMTGSAATSQPITGTWRGKVKKNNLPLGSEQVELKLVRSGDSLSGSAYYFQNRSHFEKVTIKGYIDPYTGTVSWWGVPGNEKQSNAGMVFEVDYNCPGEGILMLDGTASTLYDDRKKSIAAHFQKVDDPFFHDEWDDIITGQANDPSLNGPMDSAYHEIVAPMAKSSSPQKVIKRAAPQEIPVGKKQSPPKADAPPVARVSNPPRKPTTEEMLVQRSKKQVAEIPIYGDSVELDFYDNAEIDGDSIAVFLNGKLIFEHVLLKASAFSIKLPVSGLNAENELIMVAENLGTIPPNTSLMVAHVDGNRYEATLESTEGSSAAVRFYKSAKRE